MYGGGIEFRGREMSERGCILCFVLSLFCSLNILFKRFF